MSQSQRILVAVGLAALTALIFAALIFVEADNSQRVFEHQASKAAQEYRDTARVHAERACAGVSVSERYACEHEQYHAAWERERNQYDLQAQLVTSAWTRAMGLASVIAMFFGIVGVGLVYATFDATRRTADEAKRSADAFIDAERPHLRVHTRGAFNEKSHPDKRFVILTVENFGQSPAIVELVVWGELADTNFPGDIENFQLLSKHGDTLPPADRPFITRCELPRTAKFAGGFVQYRSRFKPDHRAFFLVAAAQEQPQVSGLPRRKEKGWPEDT